MIQHFTIEELLPHRHPFIMVDKLISCSGYLATTEMTIKENNLFCSRGYVSEAGLLENMAQTCAARLGYKSLINKMSVKVGIIGAVKNFCVYFCPEPGDRLITNIEIEHEVFNAIILHSEVHCNGKTAATCHMKLFLTDIESRDNE